ncbi:hypothetical protein [Micromonospora sp. CB01531]|uniref:hypothetical protein n=1 Tax=Micromonospora sp. CB01531 TaxID=1718947 RepID=UPI000AD04DD3|nr:hypothetical protein [Micromonospora sp. CB01531]
MRKKWIAKKAAFIATATAFMVVLFSAPASAAAYDAYYYNTHAQADNSPGNGAASWVWVWNGGGSGVAGGSVDYQLMDGSSGSLEVSGGYSASRSLNSDVTQFRACQGWARSAYYTQWLCSDWYTVP